MYNYYLTIELPLAIKSQLANLCFGPQQIHWVETQDLYFIVKSLGAVSEENIRNIQEALDSLFVLPFSFVLEGVKNVMSNESGVLGLDTCENPLLHRLKKEIDLLLKDYRLKKTNGNLLPVTLGYYENLSFERLSDYLMAHGSFQSDPILVEGITLVRSRQSTSRRLIMEEIAFYPVSLPAMGED